MPYTGAATVDTLAHVRNALVREAALMRMRKLNSRHGTLALDLRNRPDTLGPHAVALLYLAAGPTGADEVVAAWRLFRDATDVRFLPELLTGLAAAATAKLDSDGPYDPRWHLAHRYDRMPDTAPFVGIGVSSLDTPAGGRWVDVRTVRGLSALDIVGRSRIVLRDGTRLILDRGGVLGNMGTTYAHIVDEVQATPGPAIRPYQPLPAGPDERAIWSAMSNYGSVVSRIHRDDVQQQAAARRLPRQRGGSARYTSHRAAR